MSAHRATVAWQAIQRLAHELRRREPALSEPVAIAEVTDGPAGRWWSERMKRAQRRSEGMTCAQASRRVTKDADTPPWGEAWAAIQKAAGVLRQRDPGLSEAAAVTRVVTEQPGL